VVDLEHADAWKAIIHPDEIETVWSQWQDAVERGVPYEAEVRMREAATGEYRWHISRAVPMRDSAGRVVRWFGTSTDIHDQKRLEDFERFLAEASTLLHGSLDYRPTLSAVARLVIENLADWCTIDVPD